MSNFVPESPANSGDASDADFRLENPGDVSPDRDLGSSTIASEEVQRADRQRPRIDGTCNGRPDEMDASGILKRAKKVEPRLPERFGKYRVVRQIGLGQFGLVYEAVDEQLRRRVAVKAARDETCANEQLVERFVHEALMGSRLDHPGIVPIYEINFDETGRLYIAMALCESRTLDRWMGESRPIITHGLAVRLVLQILDAVEHGHQRGVIHRDIKPANIGVTDAHGQSSGTGIPTLRVLDFGLSCPIDERSSQTMSDAVLGTPLYMAPEQAISSHVTHRADLYSIGVVLYELLTGEVPFEGKDRFEILDRLRNDEPKGPEQHDPTISSDLAAVVLKALAKRPHQRYATAREFSDDLRRWLDRKPTAARPRNFLTKLANWTSEPARIQEAGMALVGMHVFLIAWAALGIVGATATPSTFSSRGFEKLVWCLLLLWMPVNGLFVWTGWRAWCGHASIVGMRVCLGFSVAAFFYYFGSAIQIFSPLVAWFSENPTASWLLHLALGIAAACDVALLVTALLALQSKQIEDALRSSRSGVVIDDSSFGRAGRDSQSEVQLGQSDIYD